MNKKILIMWLPWSWKTTLARKLSQYLNAVWFNADEIRQNINKELWFSKEDRIEQSRRMWWLCDRIVEKWFYAIADFVCPTQETRVVFWSEFTLIWIDRIKTSRFLDTDNLFQPPQKYDLKLTSWNEDEYFLEAKKLFDSTINRKKPTALLVWRYQPFHDWHKKLFQEALARVWQVCIAIRDTYLTDEKNPFSFDQVKDRINNELKDYHWKYEIISLPNITNIYYWRDVWYKIERIYLDEETEKISWTKIRQKMGL